jgi:hypothetical protein
MWRYARAAAWCVPYANRIRLTGVVYAAGVALPVAVVCYALARAVQSAAGLPPPPAEPVGGDDADRWRRWRLWWASQANRRPVPLAALAREPGAGAAAAVAVSAVFYALAWVAARPGRMVAAGFLAGIVLIFT